MKNSTKQVVILDNFSSPYIYQAILILKDYNPALEDKVIAEAEKVVSDYLNKPYKIYNAKIEKNFLVPILISILITCTLAISAFFLL